MNNRRLILSALALCLLLIGLLLTLFRFQQKESQRNPEKVITNHNGKHVETHKSQHICPKSSVKSRVGICVKSQTQTPKPSKSSCPKGLNKNRNDVCVMPNPTSTLDWVYPSGKPSLPRVTTPPEESPPVVETSRAGGGGVVDNPTNSPSSESGVTAPSASPAPTTPRPTPSNEGGSNDGVVGGF